MLAVSILTILPIALAAVPVADASVTREILRLPDAAAGVGTLNVCPDATAPDALSSGVQVSGNDANPSGTAPDCHYKITVSDPTGMRLRVVLATTEDHDLYVKLGSPATTTPYACSATGTSATSETCTVDPVSAGDYYVRVTRWTAGTGNFLLTAFVEPLPVTCALGTAPTEITPGTPITTSVTLDAHAKCHFFFTFPAGTNLARVNLTPTNSSNNVNLYVKYGAQPAGSTSPTGAECSSTLSGTSVDTCAVTHNGQTMFVAVHRPAGGTFDATFTLRVDAFSTCSLGSAPVALSDGVAQLASLTWDQRANCVFSFAPGALGNLARFNSTPATDNFDLRVKANGIPAPFTGQFDCAASLSGVSTDSCSVAASPTDTLYAIVFRPLAGLATRDFTIRADALNTCSLGAGITDLVDSVPTLGALTTDVGAACMFRFEPAPDQDTISVTMELTTSDFDLYVRSGAPPTTTLYDCRPFTGGLVNEACTFPNTGATVYAMVRRFGGSGAFSITARAYSPCSFGNGDGQLLEGVAAAASLTTDVGATCYFKFTPADGFDGARFTMDSPNGDFDLYAQVGARPTTSSFACASLTTGAELCDVATSTEVFAAVRRVSGSGEFTITAVSTSSCSLGPGIHPLPLGTNVTAALNGQTGAKCQFRHTPPSTGDFSLTTLAPTEPSNFDMYVKRGGMPTTTSYDCAPLLSGSAAESCQLLVEGSDVFVLVRRTSGSGDFTLGADTLVIPTLDNLVPAQGVAADGTLSYWKVVVPENASTLAIGLLGDPRGNVCAPLSVEPATICARVDDVDSRVCAPPVMEPHCATYGIRNFSFDQPDADLYVRHAAGLPTTSTYTCSSRSPGVVDACAFSDAATDAVAALAANVTQLRADAWAACPDPEACGENPLPTWPGLPSGASVMRFPGAGKYFVAVRGVAGSPAYAIVAAYA